MRRRSFWRTCVVSAIAGASLLTAGTAAAAAVTLKSAVSIDDGTAPFDAMAGPGLDTSPNNQIVRTNDNVTYQLSVAPSATVTNTTFTLVLPRGEEMTGVPGVCVGPGSKVVPATLPPPAVPTTALSYLGLMRQTLTCNVGTVGVGSSLKYPVVAKVRPEVPNGALLVLGPADLTVSADGATSSSPPPPAPITVSAQARFDLSKQSTCVNNDPNCGYFFGPLQRSCSNDATKACQFVYVPILISGPAGGRGSTPLASPITFTEDLTPASLYPAGAVAAAEANLPKYGATLFNGPGCGYGLYASPGYTIGGPYTATNAVRNSGTVSCSQAGGPGTPVTVTITNPDTTAFTCPSTTPQPAGTTLPADRCYVVSLNIAYEVPVDAINDLGIASGNTHAFATTDYFKNFTAVAIDGTPNAPEPLANNRRNIGYKTEPVGGFNKWFAGIPGNPQNVPPIQYSPGLPIMEGPPGGGTLHSGNIPALSGQGIISQDYFQQTQQVGPGPISTLTCDSWDNTKLWLKAANYPASTDPSGNYGQHFPSNGKAAWVSASIIDYGGPNQRMDQQFAATVQYGTGQPGGPGAAAQCDDSSSPAGWVSDPATLPGNDPAKAATGVYTAVTRVRAFFQIPYSIGGTLGTISIGQVVADSPGPNGTRVPNWANVKYDYTGGDFAHIRTNAVPWVILNGYEPLTNAGAFGDRLTIANDFVRLKKEVRTAFSGGFVTTTPQTSGGQTVDYRLSPTVNAGVPTSKTDDLTVEDCLPVGQSYLTTDPGSPGPAVVQLGSPPGAGITCSAGQTYVKWVLPGQTINSAVTPIVYHVRIGATATPGTQTNTAIVSSTGDVSSPAADRTATASVQITQPSGVVIDKTALTPLVQVNRTGSAKNDLLKWQINFSNLNAPGTPHDVDVIDVLPQNGANGSSFGGTLALSSVTVTAGSTKTQPVQVLYSADPVVSSDPTDPSNAPLTATNTYCDAANGGTAIIGHGACPTGLASVRAVRLLRPGSFNNGEVITAEVDLLPVGNAKADVYVNRVGGDSAGLLPVGPVDAPETITASSFGHLVWWDYNKNGVQDPGEPGIANVKIDVTGTDDLGNPVSLSVVTDATGNYTVPNLRAGNYRAVVDSTTLPSGAQPVYDLDNGINGANSDSGPFTLKQSQDRIDVNFGYRPVPSISTTTSAATGLPGSPLSDVVKVTNTQGQAGSLAWQLLGPVTPAAGQSCTDVSYAAAPVAGSGTVAVTGDGSYTVGPVSTGQPGCYSWTEILSGPSYNADATSAAGLAPESTLISLPPPTPTPSTIIPGLPNTGAGGHGATLLGGLLLLVGLGLSGLLGRRRLLRSLRGARSHPSA